MISKFGVELELGVKRYSLSELRKYWDKSAVKIDGSLSCKCFNKCYLKEFTFGFLSYPKDIVSLVKCIFHIYNEFKVVDVNKTMGTHVHISPPPVLSFNDFENIVNKYKDRSWFKDRQGYNSINLEEEWVNYPMRTRQRWVNFQAIDKHKTLEIRFLPAFDNPYNLIDEIVNILDMFNKYPTEIEFEISKGVKIC